VISLTLACKLHLFSILDSNWIPEFDPVSLIKPNPYPTSYHPWSTSLSHHQETLCNPFIFTHDHDHQHQHAISCWSLPILRTKLEFQSHSALTGIRAANSFCPFPAAASQLSTQGQWVADGAIKIWVQGVVIQGLSEEDEEEKVNLSQRDTMPGFFQTW